MAGSLRIALGAILLALKTRRFFYLLPCRLAAGRVISLFSQTVRLSFRRRPRDTFRSAGIRLETWPVTRLVARDQRLHATELSNGTTVPCEVLFAHPPQRHVDLVQSLGLALDEQGCVRIDAMRRETSVPGIYTADDLTTWTQGALIAAAAGTHAAAMSNVELMMDLAASGAL